MYLNNTIFNNTTLPQTSPWWPSPWAGPWNPSSWRRGTTPSSSAQWTPTPCPTRSRGIGMWAYIYLFDHTCKVNIWKTKNLKTRPLKNLTHSIEKKTRGYNIYKLIKQNSISKLTSTILWIQFIMINIPPWKEFSYT